MAKKSSSDDKKKKTAENSKPVTTEEKEAALKRAIAQIKKQFGDGAIMRLGEAETMDVDVIPTGSPKLDLALGVGGIPRGRIVEIYGSEGSGKTTLALHIIAEAQKLGGKVAMIDVEHALDPTYAKDIGVNIDDMLISQPDSGEQALAIVENLVRSGAIDVVVVDSVAALTTQAEIDGDMGDAHVGQLARLMSQAMRKLTSIISDTNCCAIFINQIREKIGVMFQNPETTTGGRALKYYSSLRLEVRRGEFIKNGSEFLGAKMKIRIVKNKVAPPFRTVECDLIFGKGISKWAELLDMAVDFDIIKKSGSWFSYGDEKLGQGRDNVIEMLKNDEKLGKPIEEAVRAKLAEIKAENKRKMEEEKKAEEKALEDDNSDSAADTSIDSKPTDNDSNGGFTDRKPGATGGNTLNGKTVRNEDLLINPEEILSEDEEGVTEDGGFEEFSPVDVDETGDN